MPAQRQPEDANWTGAEISACCRLAALLDVPLVAGGPERRAGGRDRLPSPSSGCGPGPPAAA